MSAQKIASQIFFILGIILTVLANVGCLLLYDVIMGRGIDPEGGMGAFLIFILFAPLSSLSYGTYWLLGGREVRKRAIYGLAIVWGLPILVMVLCAIIESLLPKHA